MDRPSTASDIVAVEAAIRAALSEGRAFAAYDLADTELKSGNEADILRLLAATALIRSGAIDAARDEIAQTEVGGTDPSAVDADSKEGLLLAEVLEELWQTSGEQTDRRQALAIRLRRAQSNGGFVDTAHAALLTQAGKELSEARHLAREALQSADDTELDQDRLLARAELTLIVGDEAAAKSQLEQLAIELTDYPLKRVQVRRSLESLEAQGVAVDTAHVDLFELPVLVVFAGTRPRARPDAQGPVDLGKPLMRAIDGILDELKPAVAYGSAAAGCDLLFCEALLDHGTELNIILPFQRGNFRERMVAPYGVEWLARFDRVLSKAAQIVEVCQEKYFGDDALLRFGNQVIDGTARLRGAAMSSPPYLVAVWDYLAEPFPGSPNDFIDHWGDPGRLRLIGLDEVAGETDDGLSAPPISADAIPRPNGASLLTAVANQRVASLMFADVVGFSRLTDDQLPLFWQFMNAVAVHLGAVKSAPQMINNWGDAIFTVHDGPMSAAGYATALDAAFKSIDSRQFGLPEQLKLRIGLHAGPIFEGDHPLTGQRVAYGGNVNRAARIEPITVPGHVYASEQFVAVLTAEEGALEAESRLSGQTYRPRYRCIYRGYLELAKGYGVQSVYEVEPWRIPSNSQAFVDPGIQLHAILSNELGEHQRLADLFEQLIAPLDLPEDIPSLFGLAFDEIITNICSYAWQDEARHTIDVEIAIHDDRIEAIFSDDGAPFDPLSNAAPVVDLDIDDRVAGGVGIHLVNELMDELHYRRDDGFNRLTVVKRLSEITSKQAS
jgi:anti-sigma regulatory factor (Ser/Thr protein kinase)/class 3 adenylate cyclase